MLKPNFSRQSEKFLLKLQKGQPKHAKQIALKIDLPSFALIHSLKTQVSFEDMTIKELTLASIG